MMMVIAEPFLHREGAPITAIEVRCLHWRRVFLAPGRPIGPRRATDRGHDGRDERRAHLDARPHRGAARKMKFRPQPELLTGSSGPTQLPLPLPKGKP
jgi:hypothetical protein